MVFRNILVQHIPVEFDAVMEIFSMWGSWAFKMCLIPLTHVAGSYCKMDFLHDEINLQKLKVT